MQKIFIFLTKGMRRIKSVLVKPIDLIRTYFVFYSNGATFTTIRSHGVPKINVILGGELKIGEGLKMNNRESSNPIGRFHACSIIVGSKGKLIIGDNVGMSSTAIVCNNQIEIGNNVNLGGNVVIYDTDFHSINSTNRMDQKKDIENTATKPINIGNNVFIGAHSTILKGVSIGENSVVGACSVVSKSIPKNEIWAGNPIKFIRKIEN
jgi:acetyltransferase-like isoleucine patch superfamily enzyme